MKLIAIAALTPNGVIGMNNELPWRLREDMRRFRNETRGHAVIMGRKTWESLGGPLEDRFNIVVTSELRPLGDAVVSSVAGAIVRAMQEDCDRAFIIGGAKLYKAALPVCDEAFITRVEATELEGDAHFSEELLSGMALASSEKFQKNLDNEFNMIFERWVR